MLVKILSKSPRALPITAVRVEAETASFGKKQHDSEQLHTFSTYFVLSKIHQKPSSIHLIPQVINIITED